MPALAYGPAVLMACSSGIFDAPDSATLAFIRSLDGYTDGHLRFHGEPCVCADLIPYRPSYILAITATESIIKRSEWPYMRTLWNPMVQNMAGFGLRDYWIWVTRKKRWKPWIITAL